MVGHEFREVRNVAAGNGVEETLSRMDRVRGRVQVSRYSHEKTIEKGRDGGQGQATR